MRRGALALKEGDDGVTSSEFAQRGRAAFFFDRDHRNRTYLARQYAEYPYHVTRPLYLVDSWPGFATLLLQSVSGGLFQGDRLYLEIELAELATAQVTTQAATKVHGMQVDGATQSVDLTLGYGSYLEYLSDPLILFPGSRLSSSLTVRLENKARALIRDSFLYHDPNGAVEPRFDRFASELRVMSSDDSPLAIDRQRIEAPYERTELKRALLKFPTQGVLYVLGTELAPDSMHALRTATPCVDDCYVGVSCLPNDAGVFARVLASNPDVLREVLDTLLAKVRPVLTGHSLEQSWRK